MLHLILTDPSSGGQLNEQTQPLQAVSNRNFISFYELDSTSLQETFQEDSPNSFFDKEELIFGDLDLWSI